jgi:S-adenosylmethionine:tRNA ribosyltransferase-isomerase
LNPPAGLANVDAYDYALPDALIAREPAPRRELARLLVLVPGAAPRDETFAAFPSLLRAGDVLVLNETKVIPARLVGSLAGGGRAEALLLRPRDRADFDYAARDWYALVRPGRRLRRGARIVFPGAQATVVDVLDDGPRVLRFGAEVDLEALLRASGEIPLPPYVVDAAHPAGDSARAERYQTVFARVPGSVAAPTASLHFTPAILSAVAARGVEIVRLTLDVGIGTFRPMTGARLDEHVMHAERYTIPPETAAALARARADGRRVVAAGTTVVRALEGAALAGNGTVRAGSAETSLFITPGFRFAAVDALLPNFHLPRSTLLALVCAFAGYAPVRAAYAAAVERGYRFFSFGDAMFCERAVPALHAAGVSSEAE